MTDSGDPSTETTAALTKRLLRRTGSSLVLRVTGLALAMAIALILARLMGPADYGTYAYAVAWLGFLTTLTMMGGDHVLVRFVPAYEAQEEPNRTMHVFWNVLRRGALAATTGAAAAVAVVIAVDPTATLRAALFVSISIVPVVTLAQLVASFLRGLHHIVAAQVAQSVVYPLALIGGVVAAVLLGDRLTPVVAVLINAVAWTLALSLLIVLVIRLRPAPADRGASSRIGRDPEWRRMVPSLVVVALAHHMVSRGDVLLVGLMSTTQQVGLYTVASRAAEPVHFILEAVTFAGVPMFVSLMQKGDAAAAQRFLHRATRAIVLLSAPVLAGILVFAPWVMRLFGPGFEDGASALRILAVAFMLSACAGFAIPLLYSTGHATVVARTVVGAAILNVVLAVILIPLLQATGAALATGISLTAMTGVLVLAIRRHTGLWSLPAGRHDQSIPLPPPAGGPAT